MKTVLVYIWLLATILPTFSQWGTIAYYQINKEYITKVLCKNRDKPQLHCNGHCFLAQKLKAQQEKEDRQTGEQVRNLPVLQLFSSAVSSFEFLSPPFLRHLHLSIPYHLGTYMAPLSISVPPPCV